MAEGKKEEAQPESLLTILVGLAICFGLYKAYVWYTHRSVEIISIGKVQLVSCKFAGDRLGGPMYTCTAKNVSDDPVETDMACASFDESNRLIGSPSRVGDLMNQIFAPGEERVVDIFFDEKTKLGQCQAHGDIIQLDQLTRYLDQLRSKNLISEFKTT